MSMLREWGLESLGTSVLDMLHAGDPADIIPIKLQETPEYKARFAANEARKRKGLPVLAPAEYIENERQYRDRFRRYGLPSTFYDSQDDYRKFLEADMSPQELEDLIVDAQVSYLSAPAEERRAWQDLYGYTPDIALASMLDPERGETLRKRQIAAVGISAEAQRAFRGEYSPGVQRAEELASLGVSQQEAQRGYRDIAGRVANDQFLGKLAGENITTKDLEDEALFGDELSAAKRRRAIDQERGRFSQNYLGVGQGALSHDTTY